jgi:hypothetical protein
MQLEIFEFWVRVWVNTMILSLAKTCGLKPIPKNPKIKNPKSKGPKFIGQNLTLTKKKTKNMFWVAYLGTSGCFLHKRGPHLVVSLIM